MLKIEATKSTPYINISFDKCIFEIEGNSFATDTDNIFKHVLKYVNENLPVLDCDLICEFKLYVLNSVTYKYILQIINIFTQYYKRGKSIKIIWYYESEDEDNKESAEDLTNLFNIPFELKEIHH